MTPYTLYIFEEDGSAAFTPDGVMAIFYESSQEAMEDTCYDGIEYLGDRDELEYLRAL